MDAFPAHSDGTAAADSSGNGRDGTIVNGTWAAGSPFDANLPPETPLEVTTRAGLAAEGAVRSMPHVVHVFTAAGGDGFYGLILERLIEPS